MEEQENDIICWWSGGVTSAVACKIAIDMYGIERCRIIMLDTRNEDIDTYRFLTECETWYGKDIELWSRFETPEYIEQGIISIEDVWSKYNSLNTANGAICSGELKRDMRIKFEKTESYDHQVFGFDAKEPNRAFALKKNYPKSKPIYPLLYFMLDKKECIDIIEAEGIEVPRAYKYGLNNNNCLNTGCVQGGIGYWQLLRTLFPEKFNRMAQLEHRFTNNKKKPVTILKDQSKEAKESGNWNVFLLPHPDYPNHKDLSMMKGRKPKPLFECNGFSCAVNDLGGGNRDTKSELYLEKDVYQEATLFDHVNQ